MTTEPASPEDPGFSVAIWEKKTKTKRIVRQFANIMNMVEITHGIIHKNLCYLPRLNFFKAFLQMPDEIGMGPHHYFGQVL